MNQGVMLGICFLVFLPLVVTLIAEIEARQRANESLVGEVERLNRIVVGMRFSEEAA
jgi:hypothetical protein